MDLRPDPGSGTLLGGRFRLGEVIFHGSSGTLWTALDQERGDICLAKVLDRDVTGARQGERILREAQALRAVVHPNLVRLRETILEPENGLAVLLLERLEGEELPAITSRGALPARDVVALLMGCARGLGALHERGILHRDLQPRNVIVVRADAGLQPVIIDLGLAEVHRSRRLAPELTGTLGFVAPETLLEGSPDHRADYYSLGALLYFVLAGEAPLGPQEILDGLARGEDPFLAVERRARDLLPPLFAPIASRLLARSPAARFPSLRDLAQEVASRTGIPCPVETAQARRLSLAAAPFVSRRAERRLVLGRLLASLRGGEESLVVLSGPSGSGRTRFVEEIWRGIEDAGHPVLRLRPRPVTGGPFSSILGALREQVRRLPPGTAGSVAGIDALLAPGAAGPPEGRSAIAGSRIARTLRDAGGAPLRPALVADDVESLDPGSLQVLHALLPAGTGEPPGLPAMLVAFRDPFPEGPPDLQAVLRRCLRPGVARRVELRPLTARRTGELLRALLPIESLPDSLVRRVFEASEGLPGGVVDLAGVLLDSGRVAFRGGSWVLLRPGAALPIPETHARAVRRRIEALPAPHRTALRLLALCGGSVEPETWGDLLRASGAEPAEGASLRDAGLLGGEEGGDAVTLSSERVRAGLLADDSPPGSAALSGTCADALARRGEGATPRRAALLLDAGRTREALAAGAGALATLRIGLRMEEAAALAARLLETARGPGCGPAAAEVLEEAATLAYLRRQPEVARRLAGEGLDGAPTAAHRVRLLLRLLEVDAFEGRLEEVRLEELAAAGAGPEEMVRARLAFAMSLGQSRRRAECRRVLESLLADLDGNPAARVRALNGLAGLDAVEGRLDEAESRLEETLVLSRSLGDAGATAVALRNLAMARTRRGRHRSALPLVEEAARLSGELSPADAIVNLHARVSILEGLGRWRRAGDGARRAALLAEEAGLPDAFGEAAMRTAVAELRQGRVESGLQWMTRALKSKGGRPGFRERACRLALASFHAERGEPEDAARNLGEVAALPGGLDFRRGVVELQVRALAEGAGPLLGDVEALLGQDECAAWPEERFLLRQLRGRALLALGRHGEAADLAASAERDARSSGAVEERARALLLLGTARATGAGEATAIHRRLARLGGRLETAHLRAACLEAAGEGLLREPALRAEAGVCLRAAAAAWEDAGLGARAKSLETRTMNEIAVASDWRGLRADRLAWVLDRTRDLNAAENPEEVLATVLDSALALTGAERGFLVIPSPGGFEVRVARAIGAGEIGVPGATLSASLVEKVLREGRPVTTTDARADPRLSGFFSVHELQLRSVLVVPIRRARRILGAFYLDNRLLEGVFREEDRRVLEMLAEQAALAFENVSYRARIRNLNRALEERMQAQEKEIDGFRQTVRTIRRESKYAYEGIIRSGPAMNEVLRMVDQAVDSEIPVLLQGESGTGKEVVARAIHFHGALKNRPFVVVNCAALPESLIEAELFGHRRGAFTDAHENRRGQFEVADGGTLFLDEIGDMPLSIQPKLLRALQFGEFVPLGSSETRRAKVRLICATNRDLKGMLGAGAFREDLYFRIAVLPIRIPPLRERLEDIPGLAESVLHHVVGEMGRGPRRIHPRALARLLSHSWPGNVRELENVLRRAVLGSPGDVLGAETLHIESEREGPQEESALVVLVRESLAGGMGPREERALRMVLKRQRITFRDYVQVTGVSKATAARDLRNLLSARVLLRRGRTTAAFYELSPQWKAKTSGSEDRH